MDDGLTPEVRAEAERARHAIAMQLKAAEARTPGDWVDIFQSIIEQSVKTTMETNGDGKLVLEKLAESRTSIAAVRERFMAHGLPLLEDVEIEGPEVSHDAMGYLTKLEWPRGEWVKFFWPGRTGCLEFRGHKALTALSFIMWWENFHQTAQQWDNQLKGKSEPEQIVRQIAPGSPEWVKYYAEKAADLKRMGI